MFKKISLLIVGVMVVALYGVILPDKAETVAPKPQYGDVKFIIGHGCVYDGGPRPWVLGKARHRNLKEGRWRTDTFRHRRGNEYANFKKQLAGPSEGDARITLGWKTCKNCRTDMHNYTVKGSSKRPYPLTLVPAQGEMVMKPR